MFNELLRLLIIMKEGQETNVTRKAPETEAFMEWTYTLGLESYRTPNLGESAALIEHIMQSAQLFKCIESVDWVYLFCNETVDLAQDFEIEVDFYHWHLVPWRRSAIKFFIEIYGNVAKHLEQVFLDELGEIDSVIERIHSRQGGFADEFIPEGIPFDHWWWRKDGKEGINRSERRPYVGTVGNPQNPNNALHIPANPDHLASSRS